MATKASEGYSAKWLVWLRREGGREGTASLCCTETVSWATLWELVAHTHQDFHLNSSNVVGPGESEGVSSGPTGNYIHFIKIDRIPRYQCIALTVPEVIPRTKAKYNCLKHISTISRVFSRLFRFLWSSLIRQPIKMSHSLTVVRLCEKDDLEYPYVVLFAIIRGVLQWSCVTKPQIMFPDAGSGRTSVVIEECCKDAIRHPIQW